MPVTAKTIEDATTVVRKLVLNHEKTVRVTSQAPMGNPIRNSGEFGLCTIMS